MLGTGLGLDVLKPGDDPALQGLKLDFAAGVYARDGVGYSSLAAVPGLSFLRSGAATANRANGQVAVFADGAARLTDRGLLIEEASVNLFARSQELDHAAWIKSNAVATANTAAAPDGTVSADRLTSTATTSVAVQQSVAVGATFATASVYIRKGSGATDVNAFRLRNVTTATTLVEVSINHDSGALTYVTGSSGAVLGPAVGGWRRLSLSAATGVSSGDTLRFDVGFMGVVNSGAYADVWGAQLEAAPRPSSYTATTATAASRGADSLTVAHGLAAGADMTEAGVVEFTRDTGQAACILDLHDGTDGNRVHVERSAAGELRAYVTIGGLSQLIGAVARTGARTVKWALSRAGDRYALVVDGQMAGSVEAPGLPSLSGRRLGARRAGSAWLNDYLVEQSSIPWAMPDSLMQSRTA